MKWHWGKPKNAGELRFHTNTLLSKGVDGKRMATKQFSRTEIASLYGFSTATFFIGWIVGGQRGFDSSKPVPYRPADGGNDG